ncbi:MAG: primosomal protein N' [Clostridia bacterium]|nr:primosomal protein N' [Clostridia bacterium]
MTVKICLLKSNNDFDMEYTYIVPEHLVSEIDVGVFVTVPFGKGNSLREALVVSVGDFCGEVGFKLKKINDIIRKREKLSPDLVELCREMQKRYLCAFGSIVSLMMPPELPEKRKIKFVKLTADAERVSSLLLGNELRGIKQIRCVEVLRDSENNVISLEALQRDFDIQKSSVDTLVKKGIAEIFEEEAEFCVNTYNEFEKQGGTYPVHELNEEQVKAFNNIKECIESPLSSGILLHGITGSGKTEVYLNAIKYVVEQGGSAIMLVPEIALTPQIVSRFKSRFGENIAVLHSRLTAAQKRNEYEKIKEGIVKIVIGARSAVFAPCKNLKLIILDEEQEPSYKSYDSTPYYCADEIAFMRSRMCGGAVVLGSATPRVTTYYESLSGKLKYSYLGNRASKGTLPGVCIVNMREESEKIPGSVFSKTLFAAMKKNYEAGKQTILFVPRRGYAGKLVCGDCGKTMVCRRCRIPMTYHKKGGRLICHYCGNTITVPEKCPSCNSSVFNSRSIGTESVEAEIKKYFENADVIRMDADTTTGKEGHKVLLEKFEKENIPFLVGTQMIAKGLDFPNVTLVGVLNADGLINIQEYTAGERAFQLLTQVFGRAGRGDDKGYGILQTMITDEPLYSAAINQEYDSFYKNEIGFREAAGYPPFVHICTVNVSGIDDKGAFSLATKLRSETEKIYDRIRLSRKEDFAELFKVTRSPVPKLNNRYRWIFNIKSKSKDALLEIMEEFAYKTLTGLSAFEKEAFRITFDIE